MSETVLATKGCYRLEVQPSITDGTKCYVLVNTKTGVSEVETKVLPQAYQFLRDLDIGLDEAIREYNEGPVAVQAAGDNVVNIH